MCSHTLFKNIEFVSNLSLKMPESLRALSPTFLLKEIEGMETRYSRTEGRSRKQNTVYRDFCL